MTSILRKMCDNEEDNWAKMLPMCLLSMRTSKNRATGASPFQITYNCEPRLPVYVDYESSSESRAVCTITSKVQSRPIKNMRMRAKKISER